MGDDEWVSELGLSMERRLFGGNIRLLPLNKGSGEFTETNLQGRRPFALTLLEFPGDHDFRVVATYIDRDQHWVDPMISTQYLSPTLYAVHLQSDDYWENVVGRFGIGALKMPRYFKADKFFTTVMNRTFSATETTDLHEVFNNWNAEEVDKLRPSMESLYQSAVDDFTARKQRYNALRPWYDAECKASPAPSHRTLLSR